MFSYGCVSFYSSSSSASSSSYGKQSEKRKHDSWMGHHHRRMDTPLGPSKNQTMIPNLRNLTGQDHDQVMVLVRPVVKVLVPWVKGAWVTHT
jgi:hypothetical protein